MRVGDWCAAARVPVAAGPPSKPTRLPFLPFKTLVHTLYGVGTREGQSESLGHVVATLQAAHHVAALDKEPLCFILVITS
jgi:hypothetical protein